MSGPVHVGVSGVPAVSFPADCVEADAAAALDAAAAAAVVAGAVAAAVGAAALEQTRQLAVRFHRTEAGPCPQATVVVDAHSPSEQPGVHPTGPSDTRTLLTGHTGIEHTHDRGNYN